VELTKEQTAMILLGKYINGEVKLSEIDKEIKEIILELCTQRLECVHGKIQKVEEQIEVVKKYLEE